MDHGLYWPTKSHASGRKKQESISGCFTCGIFSNTTSQINPHGASVLKGFKRSYPFFESFKITFHSLESTGTGWIRHTRNDAHPRVIKSALWHSSCIYRMYDMQITVCITYLRTFNCTNTHRKERLIFQESFHWLSAAGMKSFCLKNHAKLSSPPEWMPWRLFLRLERCFSRPRWDFLQTTNCQTVGCRSCDHEALRSHDHRRRDLLLIPRPFLQGHLLPTRKQIACHPVTTGSKVLIW